MNRRIRLRRTPFDLPLAVFLITAGIGYWVAYDRRAASLKLLLILGATLIYYFQAGRNLDTLWRWAGFLGFLGAVIAVYFLISHDWRALPADSAMLNRFALRWMALRPRLALPAVHPNIAAGLIAMLVPFAGSQALHGWGTGHKSLFYGALGIVLLSFVGLLLTSSRGAVLALGAGVGTLILWSLSGLAARRTRIRQFLIFALAFVLALGAVLGVAKGVPGGLIAMVGALPGPASAPSRLELALETKRLLEDFPFTGAGLASFPGMYARYMRDLPVFYFGYSHNLILDLAFEQSPIGLLAFLAIALGSVWRLLARPDQAGAASRPEVALRWASLTSLLTMLWHGMVDDAVYSSFGLPLLLLAPGMAAALARPAGAEGGSELRAVGRSMANAAGSSRPIRRLAIGGALLVGLACLYALRGFLGASWYANMGALKMARIELAGFPTGEWDDGQEAGDLKLAESQFNQALASNPGNRTAHHRLGLIRMLRRDYRGAITHLEQAYRADPRHRGIQKVLAYSYVWTGQFGSALRLLSGLPEAGYELRNYVWWWGNQGREDFAERASRMIELLSTSEGAPAQ